MDEHKETLGRSRIYTGNRDDSRSEETMEEGRRSRHAQPIGTVSKEHLSESSGRRRRDEETEAKMRLLWGVLFLLIVILVAAIIYEFVLGYGIRETGAERMGTNTLETELSDLTEENDTEQESQTEDHSEEEATTVIVYRVSDSQDTDEEPETEASQDTEEETETEASQEVQVTDGAEGASLSLDTTLAGLAE